jgi:hypothetical protein
LRDRGGGDALKAFAVYNDSQMYEWTGSRDRRCFDQYTIQGDQVIHSSSTAANFSKRMSAVRGEAGSNVAAR